MDQLPIVTEWSSIDGMSRDVAGALADGARKEPLDRVRERSVQLLLARDRDGSKQRLPHEFMAEGKRALRAFGTGDNDSHLLGFLDDVKKFVNVYFADAGEQLKTEAAADHRGGGQHALIILVEALQSAAYDQAHVFRDVELIDREIGAELAGGIIEFSILEHQHIRTRRGRIRQPVCHALENVAALLRRRQFQR